MAKKFQRRREDFYCEHCGMFVQGNGYTNHCPQCFWSKHVDVNPGDRAEKCGGLMNPVRIESKGGDYRLVHKCSRCGVQRNNKIFKEDDITRLLELFEKVM